jgi:putative membrane protein
MMFGVLILWAVLIALALWAVASLFPRQPKVEGTTDSATEPRRILARRYARGEISIEEYERLRHELGWSEES